MNTCTCTCTCAAVGDHVVAYRRTADGRPVEVWSTGAVTGACGVAIDGVPVARPRTAAAVAVELAAAWLLAGEVSLYELAELPVLHACARRVARAGGSPGDLRAAVAAAEERTRDEHAVPIRWEHVSPGCRVGHLPRLRWPHLAVWHEAGVYEVMVRERAEAHGGHGETLRGTGMRFSALRDLRAHLATT